MSFIILTTDPGPRTNLNSDDGADSGGSVVGVVDRQDEAVPERRL